MAWSGEAPDGDMPYLLAYTLGDGQCGPEGSTAAVADLLTSLGLSMSAKTVPTAFQASAWHLPMKPVPIRPTPTIFLLHSRDWCGRVNPFFKEMERVSHLEWRSCTARL